MKWTGQCRLKTGAIAHACGAEGGLLSDDVVEVGAVHDIAIPRDCWDDGGRKEKMGNKI